MLYKKARYNFYFSLLAIVIFFHSCTSTRSITAPENYNSSYDKSTLTLANQSVLLPYNRFLNPAGTIVKFGDSESENHSLDCITIPGENVMAVEDRYGLTFINVLNAKVLYRLAYGSSKTYEDLMSTYSGLKMMEINNRKHIFWAAVNPDLKKSYIMEAEWYNQKASIVDTFSFAAVSPAPIALPNDIALRREENENYIYVVLNGNSELVKMRLSDKNVMWKATTGMAPFGICLVGDKAYIANWGGPKPVDATKETAGIPYANVYIDPVTGATALGSVSVVDIKKGNVEKEIQTGLHPNAIIADKSGKFVYVANGNSDNVTVISTGNDNVVDSVSVKLNPGIKTLIGDSPNALALGSLDTTLYVANGMDNALAVIHLGVNTSVAGKGETFVKGFIPTGAYPSGIAVFNDSLLVVTNLEG